MYKAKIENLNKPTENLSQRVVRGGAWVFALRTVNRGLGLVRLVILARILAPADFGLMGIALLAMATLETFSQTGFNAALIQKKEDVESYLNSAWTITIVRGIVLFSILYLIAPYVAIFFKSPEAKSIIQVIGFSILFQAFTNIGIIYFQKELEFNKQFTYQLSGSLTDFVVSVSAALILRSVWALVLGLLAGNFVRFIASYLIHSYRPRLSSDLGKIKELFGFGKWILGSSILIFLLTQGDDIFIGKLLGVAALGFYQLAYKISNMPATEITHVISQVTFPAYSKLQGDIPRLTEAFLKVLQVTTLLSIPIAGLIFILAPDFTRIFLGEKWMPMVPAMKVLCIFGATRSINAALGPFFVGIGKPNILTKTSAIQLIIMMILIYPLTARYGIFGASLAVIVPNLIVLIYLSNKLISDLNLRFSVYLKPFFVSIAGTVVMMLLVDFIQVIGEGNLNDFMLFLAFGMVLYLCIIILLDKFLNYGLMNNVKQILKNFK